MLVDLQIATQVEGLPDSKAFTLWTKIALLGASHSTDAEVTIRLVDNVEMQQLNRDYRGKDQPTNVLSFPFEPYDALMAYSGDVADICFLGDIAIAPAVIVAEAQAQDKILAHHYAHMTIHGVLHLLGYDHTDADSAKTMEAMEVRMLATLGIKNPY